jgi:hypothetical protein
MPVKTDTEVQLAVYMERLDSYIETQAQLNKTLVSGLARVDRELDDLHGWRSKVYGVKTGVVALALLVLHASAVMASFIGISTWMD